jgi:hypothetical protein
VCGTKNFSSVRLHSAPQLLHRTNRHHSGNMRLRRAGSSQILRCIKKRPAIRTSTHFFWNMSRFLSTRAKKTLNAGTKREVSHCWFKGLRITHLGFRELGRSASLDRRAAGSMWDAYCSPTRAKSAIVFSLMVDGSCSRGCRIFGRLRPVRSVSVRPRGFTDASC